MSEEKLFPDGFPEKRKVITAFGVKSRMTDDWSESGGNWWAWRRDDGVVWANHSVGFGFIDGRKNWAAEPATSESAMNLQSAIKGQDPEAKPFWNFRSQGDLFAWLKIQRPHWHKAHDLLLPSEVPDPWLRRLENYRPPDA